MRILFISLSTIGLLGILGLLGSVSADGEDSKLVLFVETGCPHCEEVESFIAENNLAGNVDVRDIRESPDFAKQYEEMNDNVGINLQDRSVPMLFDGEIYKVGDSPIIEYLGEKYGIEVRGESVHSKSSIVLFILGTGIVLAGAALLISSRKSE